MTPAVMNETGADRLYGAWLCLALLTVLACRLAGNALADTDLVFDEAQYWAWSKDLAFGYFSKPPMIAWVIRGATELCGDGEACVRSISPVLHTLTACFVFLTASRLYDERIGFWSALVFATLPGISFSSTLASTDVPLLLFWSIALYGYLRLIETEGLGWTILVGVAIGLGLLAKYAMAYFVLCAIVHAYYAPQARAALLGFRGMLILALALLLVAPNLAWNVQQDFVTFQHTAQNARWFGVPIHPLSFLEFVGGQFGVVGPILFGTLLWAIWSAFRGRRQGDGERLLLSFSLPMLLLIAVQAFLSRAHANWAAVAYPAAVILVTMLLLRQEWLRLFRISLGLHLATALAIAFGPAVLPRLLPDLGADLYDRLLGWRELSAGVKRAIEQTQAPTVLTDDRIVTSEMLYYLRDVPVRIEHWRARKYPENHFDMTRPFTGRASEPILYVTQKTRVDHITEKFGSVEPLPDLYVSPDGDESRTLYLYRLSGFKFAAQ